MEKVFNLYELKFIKSEFTRDELAYYLCSVRTFQRKWYHSSLYIRKLAEKFLAESPKWSSYDIGRFLFYEKGVVENIFNSEKDILNLRQIRIDFLNWLIENIES